MQRYAVSVDVVVTGPLSEDQADALMTACEPDNGALSATDPDVTPGLVTLTVDVQSSTARAAAGKGHDRVLELVTGVGLTVQTVERLEVLTEQAQEHPDVVIPELVSQSDIAREFGVSRQRVMQLRQEGLLPEPVQRIGLGSVWVRSDVLQWAKRWNRKPSLHPKTTPTPPPGRPVKRRRTGASHPPQTNPAQTRAAPTDPMPTSRRPPAAAGPARRRSPGTAERRSEQ